MKKWISQNKINHNYFIINKSFSDKLSLNETKELEKAINDKFKKKFKSKEVFEKIQNDNTYKNKEDYLLNQNFLNKNLDSVLEIAFKNTLKDDVMTKVKNKKPIIANLSSEQEAKLNERMDILFDKLKDIKEKSNKKDKIDLDHLKEEIKNNETDKTELNSDSLDSIESINSLDKINLKDDLNLLLYEINNERSKYKVYSSKVLYNISIFLSFSCFSFISVSSKLIFFQPYVMIYALLTTSFLAINKAIYDELIKVLVWSLKINLKSKELTMNTFGKDKSLKFNLSQIKTIDSGSWISENSVNITMKDNKKYILLSEDIIHSNIIEEIKNIIKANYNV